MIKIKSNMSMTEVKHAQPGQVIKFKGDSELFYIVCESWAAIKTTDQAKINIVALNGPNPGVIHRPEPNMECYLVRLHAEQEI